MRVYIAGKISGLNYADAFRSFGQAEYLLRVQGYEPVNPMKENGLDGDGKEYPWVEYMRRDIPHLLSCDAIYLLSNWVSSKGACLEKTIAEGLGMTIFYAGQGIQKCKSVSP